jgi:hypothetical protein
MVLNLTLQRPIPRPRSCPLARRPAQPIGTRTVGARATPTLYPPEEKSCNPVRAAHYVAAHIRRVMVNHDGMGLHRLTLTLPWELLGKVDGYRSTFDVQPTRMAALRHLLELGLRAAAARREERYMLAAR